jgi:hypothetical protein
MSSNIDTALYTDASCVKRGLRVIIEEEKCEATKGVTNSHKSKKKDRQYNGQKKQDKWTTNDLHNTTQETKDRATRTPQNTGVNSGAPERLDVPAPLVTHVVYF